MFKENNVYLEDSLKAMKLMEDNSVDLIIADPPYNLSKGSNVDKNADLKNMGGKWSKVMESWDNIPLLDYIEFTKKWISEAKRIMKDTGSMWIFGTYHNIGIVNLVCQMENVEIINEIIWYKRNAFPNLSGTRLTASHETILWCHKNESNKRNYYFDYDYSKRISFDYDNLKKQDKQMRTVWDIPNNKKREELEFGKHPTQKPLRVIERIIKLSSKENDVVLAPFSGSGTECLSAIQLNRKYIGFEINQDYYDLSLKRLDSYKEKDKQMHLNLDNTIGVEHSEK